MAKLLLLFLPLLLPLLSQAQVVVPDKKQLLEDVRILAADSMEGRLSGTAGNKKAQDYLANRFRQIGLKPYGQHYRHPFPLKATQAGAAQGVNLLGYIPGKTAKVIVVSAHYDHVGKRHNAIYNGADDNASGVGALLAAAHYFMQHPPVYTLVFAAFDAEESGLQGAGAFLQHPPFPLEHILLNVNLDMLGISNRGELFASGAYHTPSLTPYLLQVTPRANAKLLLGHDRPEQGTHDWTNQSDHYRFHQKKIPFIYFGVENHAHYHKPTDTFENLHQTFYADAAALVLNFLKMMQEHPLDEKLR